jgi:DNA-binding beta-propeller fold protein YncE
MGRSISVRSGERGQNVTFWTSWNKRKSSRVIALAMFSALVAAGCGDDASSDADKDAGDYDASKAKPPKAGSTGGNPGSPEPDPKPTAHDDAGSDMKPEFVDHMELAAPSRGSAIALSEDDSVAVVVNRDIGSVSVIAIEYPNDAAPKLTLRKEVLVGDGSEPYQVAIGPDGDTAYVLLRKDQQLIKLESLRKSPAVAGSAATGSEPTSLALSPSGYYAYVANWNDGTVREIDTRSLQTTYTYDLNEALVKTGYLGDVQPRAALAHPRSIVVSNNHDGKDEDEKLYITEYFGQQVEAEAADGANSDTRKVGIVYEAGIGARAVRTISLKALTDIGFLDNTGMAAGCYPNQLQSIALNGNYAYVVSVCTSPKGPLGVKATMTSCSMDADCANMNLVEPACIVPFAGAANSICVDVSSAKTTTAPVLSVIDVTKHEEVAGSAENLNARFAKLFADAKTGAAAQRFPLFANDLAFVTGSAVAYVTANGTDSVFRLQFNSKDGTLESVGGSTNPFLDLAPAGIAADKAGKNPIGIAIGSSNKKLALVANDVSRNLTLLDFNTQAISGGATTPNVLQTAALPPTNSDAEKVLRGKRFFNTGLVRWSLRGQGWGACQSCHGDGLSDNVTWYFARGPRQATSLDGSFASKHPDDQRIFNWTAIFDEVDDFEGNTRDISGGVGAIVSAVSNPLQTSDRIDFAGLGHAGLNGSSIQASNPDNPLMFAAAPKLKDWAEITAYMQTIRSPRAPTTLNKEQVDAGRKLFTNDGACQGCHSGEKWTISKRFYTPGTATNNALKTTAFAIPSGFPAALLPSTQTANQVLRFGGTNPAALDQIQCAIRPVGTFKVAEDGVGIAELRADMKTVAQGDGDPAGEGRGYNVPSLLGVSAGAPYLHGGNARTLEALFSSTFATHTHALAPNFLTDTEEKDVQAKVSALVQYLLSIDEASEYPGIPDPGGSGGSLCPTSFSP